MAQAASCSRGFDHTLLTYASPLQWPGRDVVHSIRYGLAQQQHGGGIVEAVVDSLTQR